MKLLAFQEDIELELVATTVPWSGMVKSCIVDVASELMDARMNHSRDDFCCADGEFELDPGRGFQVEGVPGVWSSFSMKRLSWILGLPSGMAAGGRFQHGLHFWELITQVMSSRQ